MYTNINIYKTHVTMQIYIYKFILYCIQLYIKFIYIIIYIAYNYI